MALSRDPKTFKKEVVTHLSDLLEYRDDGSLIWRNRTREWFATDLSFNTWNGRYPQTIALHKIGNHGYRCGTICGVGFMAHRVIWAIHNGFWPDECDHIDGCKAHNRIENLRDTDKSGNQKNTRLRSDNTSGQVGVHLRADSGRWAAYIGFQSGLVNLGAFDTKKEAIAARKKAEKLHGFSDTHGRQISQAEI